MSDHIIVIMSLYLIPLLHFFPWLPCWRHRSSCGVKNVQLHSPVAKQTVIPGQHSELGTNASRDSKAWPQCWELYVSVQRRREAPILSSSLQRQNNQNKNKHDAKISILNTYNLCSLHVKRRIMWITCLFRWKQMKARQFILYISCIANQSVECLQKLP